MSQGDKCLDAIWSKRPLKLQPFLPEDNHPDITSNAYAWLQHTAKELSWLLHLKFPKFVSYVLFDPELRMFLDSFLRHRSRPHDISPANKTQLSASEEINQLLDRRVFFVFVRLSTFKEIEALVASGFSVEKGDKLAESCQFGELVSGEKGVLSFPKILDLAALYGLSNYRLTTKLLGEVLSMSSSIPLHIKDSGISLVKVLNEYDPFNKPLTAGGDAPPPMTAEAALDGLTYILDCAASWHALVNARPNEVFTALIDMHTHAGKVNKSQKKYCNRNNATGGGVSGGGGGGSVCIPSEFMSKISDCYERTIPHLHHCASLQVDPTQQIDHLNYCFEQSGFYFIHLFQAFLNWCGEQILFKLEEEDLEKEAEELAEATYALLLGLSQDNLEVEFQAKCALYGSESRLRSRGTFIGDYDGCFFLSKSLISNIDNENSSAHVLSVAFDRIGFDEQRLQFLGDILEGCQASKSSSDLGKEKSLLRSNGGAADEGDEYSRFKNREPTEKEMEELVTEVQMVMPELGVGFIEACVASYKFKVGDVINAIMDENLPPHLAVMDRTTPKYRVHRGKQDDRMDKAIKEGLQGDQEFAHKKRTYLKKFEDQAEVKHKMLVRDEYDDDYDDQYDEPVNFNVGHADDFEEVKQMNRFMKEQEDEDAFWQDMQNTNRKQPIVMKSKNKKKDEEEDDDEEEREEAGGGGGEEEGVVSKGTNVTAKPFVPGGGMSNRENHSSARGKGKGKHQKDEQANQKEKGKGGKGGGKGDSSSELTDAQKRRKNQNKNKGHRVGADKKMARNQF